MTLLNVTETANYLRVKKSTLYNWCSQGKIKFSKLGGLKFEKDNLDEMIKDRQKTNGVRDKEK